MYKLIDFEIPLWKTNWWKLVDEISKPVLT